MDSVKCPIRLARIVGRTPHTTVHYSPLQSLFNFAIRNNHRQAAQPAILIFIMRGRSLVRSGFTEIVDEFDNKLFEVEVYS